jgi:hypothetical protein
MNWYLPRNVPPPPMAWGSPPDSQLAICRRIGGTLTLGSRAAWRMSAENVGTTVAATAARTVGDSRTTSSFGTEEAGNSNRCSLPPV